MKTIYKIILIFVLAALLKASIFSQSGWSSQASGTTEHLLDIQFLNSTTGYSCGKNGTFLKTVNAGLFWSTISGITTDDIIKLYFIDANTGWIVSTWGNPSRKRILKTTNGGINFIIQYDDTGGAEDSDLFFSDVNNGWFCKSTNFGLQKTTNSGGNWTAIAQPWGTKIFFLNSSTGFLFNPFELHKTTNNGLNWTTVTNGLNNMRYMQFFNPTTGYGVLGLQGFAKTFNGGNNWNLHDITSNVNYQIYDACFNDLNTGWATGYANDSSRGLVYKTFNGGINWHQQFVGTDQQIRAISFVDANTGWITGYNGIIYKTTNGGGNPIGIQQISSEIPIKYTLSQNFPNPFNPETSIEFELPVKTFVNLVIYDMTGKEIETIVNQYLNSGKYQAIWQAANFSSGVYLYKIDANKFTQTKKMVLVK